MEKKTLNKTEPQTEDEIKFIRGLPYYAPQTAKTIAFFLDTGGTKKEILKQQKKAKTDGLLWELTLDFVDFYLTNTERAKELFMPYSCADYGRACSDDYAGISFLQQMDKERENSL